MKTLEQIIDIIEENGITVNKYEENGVFCGYELEAYTDGGVNEIIFLDFREEGEDPTDPKQFIEEFEGFINIESIDDYIDRNRQDEAYKRDFTLRESLEDFEAFDKKLRNILEQIK